MVSLIAEIFIAIFKKTTEEEAINVRWNCTIIRVLGRTQPTASINADFTSRIYQRCGQAYMLAIIFFSSSTLKQSNHEKVDNETGK
jgi:hypothetical protein